MAFIFPSLVKKEKKHCPAESQFSRDIPYRIRASMDVAVDVLSEPARELPLDSLRHHNYYLRYSVSLHLSVAYYQK